IEDRSERAVRDTAGVDDTDDERELRGRAHGHSGELGELELEPVGVTEAALGPTRAADGHAAVDVLERGREGAEVRAEVSGLAGADAVPRGLAAERIEVADRLLALRVIAADAAVGDAAVAATSRGVAAAVGVLAARLVL